ncbi:MULTISPECIES: hypothetical protein [Treponema]|uniref:Uncharacterized protein n=1 Tax=Treponema rectale TaxID=744512 RepID=A0A840SGD8_9SPIR|nr:MULTISPECIES: hypothetical protein [Treponema]MBB5218501.1 hypothetical protein [Treponema rectale]MBE6354130.1 hypothetical protein [Treponema sp.]MBO6176419.1 hypothetical protein [Treponema sp.]QOS39813.1 hypothetical protein DYE49_04830 [Treponema rectale]
MELKINGQNADVTLENEKTIGEVLKAFEEEAAKNNAATIGITINGKKILAEDFDSACLMELKDDTVIELEVISEPEIKDSFIHCGTSFETLSEKLENISIYLQSGKDEQAHAIITELANAIDVFCRTATFSALFPDTYKSIQIDGKEMGEFFKDFAPLLSDFEQALESNDTVTTGDIAEYEISPRLRKLSQSVKNVLK